MDLDRGSFPDYEELYKISFDAVEENSNNAWHSLLHNFSNSDLENLMKIFKKNDKGDETGLDKTEFLNAISSLYGGPQYNLQTNILFEEISKGVKKRITWNMFLDFLIDNINPEFKSKLSLHLRSIEAVGHSKNESIIKIVLIEMKQYFCYAIILKHGRVGLYDGSLNFLTSYHAIMTREDLTRPEDERRRRNRCITDSVFCPDVMMLIISNTARSIMIYEASGLNHVPYWLILSTPNIIECLTYKPYTKYQNQNSKHQSVLFGGDCNGGIMSFTFLNPKYGLLRRKRTDDISLFYWEDFLKEKNYVIVKHFGKVHGEPVKHIQYVEEDDLLISCSRDTNTSLILKHIENKRKTIYCKQQKGVSCFAVSSRSKMLITGRVDGAITLWNMFISKPVAVISENLSEVVDLQILENQNIFISCCVDGVLKVWDLKEYTCLQTIKLKFPPFRIQGKHIDWGINCIYPGPKRARPDKSSTGENRMGCFGIEDINEMRLFCSEKNKRDHQESVWQRSYILVTCCNYIAKIRADFNDADIEYSFTYPTLPPPPLQNSVLIPLNWGLQDDNLNYEESETDSSLEVSNDNNTNELEFILKRHFFEDETEKCNINYKIAILETRKEQMRSNVALGAPYLALDLHEIPELNLSETIPKPRKQKSAQYFQRIKSLLENASSKDEIFSSPSTSSSRSKSSKSSLVEFPL